MKSYTHPTGDYSYHIKARPYGTEVKIRISKARMSAFRKGAGSRTDKYLDIFEIGNGWYAVSNRDTIHWPAAFGNPPDFVMRWLAELNKASLGTPRITVYNVQIVKRIVHSVPTAVDPQRLRKLQAHFSH